MSLESFSVIPPLSDPATVSSPKKVGVKDGKLEVASI
jgi:hypothetical protein